MKILILEDNFSSVLGFKKIIKEIFEDSIITNCDNVATANLEYMLNFHDILLVDDSVNGLHTGIEFLKLLKKWNFNSSFILCVSSTSSLKSYEGKLFNKYTGKNYAEIEKALLGFKESGCVRPDAAEDTTAPFRDPV